MNNTKNAFAMKKRRVGSPLLVLVLISIMITTSGCGYFTDVIGITPSENNTLSGAVELANAIEEAAKNGDEELTVFVTNIKSEEIGRITNNMGLFWGKPYEYSILKEFEDSSTLQVRFYIEKTDNYYAYHYYMNGQEIPADKPNALAIAQRISYVIKKVVRDNMTVYQTELAIHDWLVKNIQYDDNIDASSTQNGTYGALIEGRTMCRGYAESMKLISECVGLETILVVGRANDGSGAIVGHAWNMIKIDGEWYHLDATYDDPIGNSKKSVHYYYFNLNDKDMAKDHEWEREFFPASGASSYIYYKKEGLYAKSISQFKDMTTVMIRNKKKSIEILVDTKKLSKDDLNFIFNSGYVKKLTWTTHSTNPTVVFIKPEYY